jgi:isopenicillin N synthase-like dioxygenase
VIPRDCIAYQIGETSTIMSGGLLRATPHAVQAVRYPESKSMGRSTFAVFMEVGATVPS